MPKSNTPKSAQKPKPERGAKPSGTVGNVTNSAFVQGENHGIVMVGNPPPALDERLNALFDKQLNAVLKSLESNYNAEKEEMP